MDTEREKCITQTTSEWKITGLKNQKTGAIFLHHSPSPGVARGVPRAMEARELPGDNGTSDNSKWASFLLLLVILGLSYTLISSLGSPSPLLKWAWPLPIRNFSKTTVKPFLKSCNWTSCMILGWCKPRGSRNQTMHSQEALGLNCPGWGLKDSLF